MARNDLPPRSLLDDFLAEANVMISYPGFGDEHYDDFRKACNALKDAYARKDLESFAQKMGNIAIIKKECHDRFK